MAVDSIESHAQDFWDCMKIAYCGKANHKLYCNRLTIWG